MYKLYTINRNYTKYLGNYERKVLTEHGEKAGRILELSLK